LTLDGCVFLSSLNLRFFLFLDSLAIVLLCFLYQSCLFKGRLVFLR